MFTGYDALIVSIGVAMGIVLHAMYCGIRDGLARAASKRRALEIHKNGMHEFDDRIRIVRAYRNGKLLGWRFSAGSESCKIKVLVFVDGSIFTGTQDFLLHESEPTTYYPCVYLGEKHAVVCYDKDDDGRYIAAVEATDAALDARDLPK